MKVLICKFFDQKDVERKIGRLAPRERKRTGNNLRVFCVDEQVQKRLEMAGIPSEFLYDFHRDAVDDETSWQEAYRLSDELYSSAGNDDTLKFSGINFLTLEYRIRQYVFLMKFSTLCRQMAEQNCQILVLVLTGIFNLWLPDINSPKIRTIRCYRHPLESLMVIRLLRLAMREASPLARNSVVLAKRYLRKLAPKDCPATTQKGDQKRRKALFFVTPSPLYIRDTLAVSSECLRSEIIPHVATSGRETLLISALQQYHIDYSIQSPLISGVPHAGRFLWLLYNLRRHVNSFYDNNSRLVTKSDEFSVAYLCKRTLLHDLPLLCSLAISNIAFSERLISTILPDIVCVMPDGHFLQQMAVELARKKYKIPTLASISAIDTDNAPSYMRHLHADKIAAMGNRAEHIYVESGIERDRITVTGVAHFDLLFNRDKEHDKQVLYGCGIDPSKRIVVFTTQPISPAETEEMLTGVIEAVLKMTETQLVIKVHPREEIEAYQAIVDKYQNPRVYVVRDVDVYALIISCELLIAKSSTTALEAMMAGKPVVTFDLSGQPVPVPYATEGAAIGVYRHEDIEEAIQRGLYDEETRSRLKIGRDKFVRNWAGEPDGKASWRMVTLMKKMIAARKCMRG